VIGVYFGIYKLYYVYDVHIYKLADINLYINSYMANTNKNYDFISMLLVLVICWNS